MQRMALTRRPRSCVVYTVREIPTASDGDVDIAALEAALGPNTAGIMLTNPSTFGCCLNGKIKQIASMVHSAGGLLYYDGANLNAILGKTKAGDMGFDVIHMNLHKTFSTPHGGVWSGFWGCRRCRAITALYAITRCRAR